MRATSVSGSTLSHLPSRSWMALSIALRWWSANSVGTTLPSARPAAEREATRPHHDPPRRRLSRAYPKTPECMFLPTGEAPATKASSSNQGDMGVSVRGFSCPSSGVPHPHVVQRLLLPSLSSGALLVRAVHGLLPSVLRAACAPLLRGSSPRACGDT